MNVNELIKKYELQILEQNGKRGVHACKNPTDTDKRDIISNMEAILVELDRRESEKNHAYEEREKKINAIEGLQEIRNAIDEIDCYKSEFDRVWESGESVYPSKPKVDVAALKAKYPRAAAYLKAESYSMSSYLPKYSSGTKALERIQKGENYPAVIQDMENEVKRETEAHLWD